MSDLKIKFPKEDVKEIFLAELKDKTDLKLINLSTLDGFLLHQTARSNFSIEADKVSAISSSLCSMSNSATSEFFSDNPGVINIESASGKIILMEVKLGKKDGVITVCCSDSMSLAEGRFVAKRMKEKIEKLF